MNTGRPVRPASSAAWRCTASIASGTEPVIRPSSAAFILNADRREIAQALAAIGEDDQARMVRLAPRAPPA